MNLNIFIISFFSPLLTFLFALKSGKKKDITSSLFILCIFFGFTFSLSKEASGGDINYYLSRIAWIKSNNFNNLIDVINAWFDSGERDYYSISITYFASLLSDHYTILTGFFAIIFGFFLSRNVKILIDAVGTHNLFLNFLILFFFMLNPIWNINGVRFYTALQVFVYAILNAELKNRKNYYLFIFITPFIHFSFNLAILILLICKFLQSFPRLVFYLFFISLLASELLTNDLLSNIFSNYNFGFISDRGSGYLDNELTSEILESLSSQKTNWYVEYLDYFIKLPLTYLAIVIFSNSKDVKDSREFKFFVFALAAYSIGNTLSNHYVIGRFFNLGSLLLTASAINFYRVNSFYQRFIDGNRNVIKGILMIFLIIYFTVSLRTGFYFISFSTVFSNPFIVLFENEFYSIIDFIK